MKRSLLLIVCLSLGWAVSTASAVPLYSVSYEGDVYTIDQATSTYQLFMVNTGLQFWDATDGPSLDAFFASGPGDSLYTIDIVNKTVAPIGAYGAPVKTLAFAETGGGVLYGSDFTNLYTIDTTTGAATLIGPINRPGDLFIGVYSMDYDPVAARLYIVSELGPATNLYYVNPGTGLATLVGPLVGLTGGSIPVDDIWYDRDTGKMYGVHSSNTQLFEINTATGQATPVGLPPFGSEACPNVMGLGSVNIPEPGMLMLLGLGLIGLASPMFRRRNR
jgi:hypothetical protein